MLRKCYRGMVKKELLSYGKGWTWRTFSSHVKEPKLFDKILIANRGEIACRVIKTAREMGIKTVACYSDADANALHVSMADEAIHIGESPATESYLRGDKIIAAALKTGAQAIHPGYGFLSENLSFCKLCKENNVTFIGPPDGAIRAMGSKSESKDIMIKANVPVTPGYHGDDQTNETLFAEAKKIGFPLMIKAVSGGGGKGMRAVFNEKKFLEDLESCRREAIKSFSDGNVLIEKLVQAPRHVELQVFADTHGNVVHLLERDCSVQRRHQKVLEEAPAPNLSPEVRKAMGDAAVACARAVGYVGAGTVEFLVDSVTSEFYFCEMNTRLQVEHPVTEMITGLDLVEWQLRVASGQVLPLDQEEIFARVRARGEHGCAIEARIYAENPSKGFLPATGKIVHMRPVTDSTSGVRADYGIRSGDTISTFYDPMIAKLIAYDSTRDKAVKKLELALREFQVSGLANNIDFLVHCVRNEGFAEKLVTTSFFDENIDSIFTKLHPDDNADVVNSHNVFGVLGLVFADRSSSGADVALTSFRPFVAGSCGDWRAYGGVTRNVNIVSGEVEKQLRVVSSGDCFSFSVGADSTNVTSSVLKSISKKAPSANASSDENVFEICAEINGHRQNATVALYTGTDGSRIVDVWIDGQTGDNLTHSQFHIPAISYSSGASSSGHPVIKSPMPGKVIKLYFKDGDTVKAGESVVVIEAMKMEHVITAPCDGIVSLFCEEGMNVDDGAQLAEVEGNKE